MKETIGLCLIGAGRAGMIHARNYSSGIPGSRIVAVSDTLEESARKAADELGINQVYTDYREALRKSGADAVIVMTPTKFHRDIVTAAAEAKKHIFCEKPMAMNREECQAMIGAAEEAGVILQIGFMRRFDANFRRAKEMVDSGSIGEVVSVKSQTRGPSTPQEWMYDIAKSNGPLAEVNSHDIDTLRWFTGSEAASLYAIAGNFRSDAARSLYPDFYDTVLMNVTMKNGMLGNIDGAQGVQYGYDAQVDILGTCGSIRIGGLQGSSALLYSKEKTFRGDTVKSWTNLFREAYMEEDISFVTSIREGRAPEVSGIDGMMAVEIVRAGNESIREKKIVYL
ncbi:MAG: Gfo/Idh/MocA family oxidoreductase [Treponema sp.]|nr:Gfo/Idh/MocA family oxidoreductase [Treponema sp.]